jgi:hypothetical protein
MPLYPRNAMSYGAYLTPFLSLFSLSDLHFNLSRNVGVCQIPSSKAFNFEMKAHLLESRIFIMRVLG